MLSQHAQPPKTRCFPLCHLQLCNISPADLTRWAPWQQCMECTCCHQHPLLQTSQCFPLVFGHPAVFAQNWGSFPSRVLWNKPSEHCVPNGNIRRGNSMQEANYQPSSRFLSVFLALRLFCCPRLCIRHSPHGSLIYWQVQGPKGAPHHKAKHVLSSLHVPAGRWVSALHIIYFL